MKQSHLITVLGLSLIAAPVLADHEKHTTSSDPSSPHRSHHAVNQSRTWRASQLLGATVRDRSGESVGQIQDIVLYPASGQAQFAVVSLNLPEHQGHLTAIPWPLIQASSDPGQLSLNVDRSRVASAQMFEASRWPDFTQPTYNQRIYSYYGLTYEQPAMGGRIPLDTYDQGTSDRPGKENVFPRPQPDGREVFPELNKRDKTEQ